MKIVHNILSSRFATVSIFSTYMVHICYVSEIASIETNSHTVVLIPILLRSHDIREIIRNMI